MRSQLLIALAAAAVNAIPASLGPQVQGSSPVSPAAGPQGFSLDLVSSGRVKNTNGAAQIMKTFLKYGKEPPTNVVQAAQAAAVQSGSVTATPEAYNSEYLAPVQFGNPAQTLMMDFDTGSSDLWVFANTTPSNQRSGHTYFNIAGSSSAKYQIGESWSVEYGDGSSSSGRVWKDTVVIGGVTATSQAVEAATSVASQFVSDTASDGLVGLAFDDLNTCTPNVCATFMENVVSTLPQPLFAAWLKRSAPGAYDFGYLNTAHYTGSIYYSPVIDKSSYGYWTLQGTGYGVNGGTETTLSYPVIVDTGTTLIYLPAKAVSAYYAKVSGAQNSASAGGYIFPCSSTLPSLNVYVSGVELTIPGTSLNYAPYSGSSCFGAVQSNAGLGISILGDAFINNFYVIFDYVSESGSSQVGFAVAK